MYSQVLRVKIQPGKMDEAVAIFRDSVAPAIHGWSGLQSGRLLVDRAENKIMAVSFWDSEADEASLQSSGSYKEQVGKLAALFAGPPEVDVYKETVGV